MLKSALNKPIAVIVALFAVAIFAALALFRIPVDIFPNLNLPTIYISQPYGGMSANQMEGFVATRYQNQMLYVSGIKDVEVKNIQGTCLVKCTFYENVDMAQVAGEVANQVNRVMNYLPPGTVPPTVVRLTLLRSRSANWFSAVRAPLFPNCRIWLPHVSGRCFRKYREASRPLRLVPMSGR